MKALIIEYMRKYVAQKMTEIL